MLRKWFAAALAVMLGVLCWLPTAAASSPQEEFDETYWSINTGPGNGGNEAALFHTDGTYEAISYGDRSEIRCGTWQMTDNTLYLDVLGGMTFHREGSGFCSDETYPVQGEASWQAELQPDPYGGYEMLFEELAEQYGEIRVEVDGSYVLWPDARPFIDTNDRTMVPLRAIAEKMGLEVSWKPDTRTAVFSGSCETTEERWTHVTVSFRIDSRQAEVDYRDAPDEEPYASRVVEMDTNAVISEDRTYTPVRYLAEQFGYAVSWNQRLKLVRLKKGPVTVPNAEIVDWVPDGTWNAYVYRENMQNTPEGILTPVELLQITGPLGEEGSTIEVIGRAMVLIPKGVTIQDDLTPGMLGQGDGQLEELWEFFEIPCNQNSKRVLLKLEVKDGSVLSGYTIMHP